MKQTRPFEGKRILLVDDEPELLEISRYLLERKGAQVMEASSVLQALDLLYGPSSVLPDAVLTDSRMPNLSGLDLVIKLRQKDNASPPIAIVTGASDSPVDEIFDAGADAILYKPFSEDQLIKTAEHLLSTNERRWQRQTLRHEIEEKITYSVAEVAAPQSATTHNIGRGGVFIKCSLGRVDVGMKLRLRMDLGPEGVLEVDGIVRWIRGQVVPGLPEGFGVEFVALSPESVRSLACYLERVKPRSFIPRN